VATNQTTATALIALAKQRAYQPANGGPTNTAILRDLNAELVTYVAPFLMRIGEEFFVTTETFSTVANQANYDIPSDSIASKIRDVQVLADDGVSWVSLAHEEPERAAMYSDTSTKPSAYFIRANEIHLLPKPSAAGQSMRLLYYARPREIVESGYSTASGVSGPSGGNYTVTVASTTDMATGDFDIIDPETYEVLSAELPGTVTNSTTLTFAAASLTAAQISALTAASGDIFIGSGESPAADVPPEAAVLLALRVATMMMQEYGDPRVEGVLREVERVKQTLTDLFAPRASGLARKVVQRNGPGWGWSRWGARRWLG
jgi:hypothetical protein